MSNVRGIALIINNYKFQFPKPHEFPGEGRDGDELSKEFTRLNYNVVTKKNITASQMKAEIKSVQEMVKSQVKSHHDSLIVVIASHGDEVDGKQIVYGEDAKIVNDGRKEIRYNYLDLSTEVIDIFNNENCPQLKDAVKLFIIDCCRGSSDYPGIDATRLCLRNRARNVGISPSGSPLFSTNTKTAIYTKTVVVNATERGSVSTNLANGSILMWAFVKCLEKYSKRISLEKLIQKVGRNVKKFAAKENFNQFVQVEVIAPYGEFFFERPQRKEDDNEAEDYIIMDSLSIACTVSIQHIDIKYRIYK